MVLWCYARCHATNRAGYPSSRTITHATTTRRFLIAFILSSYVGMTISLWRIRRQNYASLCGNARNLNIQISSFLPIGMHSYASHTPRPPLTMTTINTRTNTNTTSSTSPAAPTGRQIGRQADGDATDARPVGDVGI